jgi:hypothetical protein
MVRILLLNLFSAFFLFSSFDEDSTKSHRINFDVKLGNNTVGALEATMLMSNGKTTYQLNSSVKISYLFNLTIQEKITDVFVDNNLQHSTHIRYVNGDQKANNVMVWNGESYQGKNKEAKLKYIKDSIRTSILSIYFREPSPNEIVFSQNYQELLPAKKIAEHTYAFSLPTGKNATYYYSNGRLELVTSESAWGMIKFVRKD